MKLPMEMFPILSTPTREENLKMSLQSEITNHTSKWTTIRKNQQKSLPAVSSVAVTKTESSIEDLKTIMLIKEIESIIKKYPSKKDPGPDDWPKQ